MKLSLYVLALFAIFVRFSSGSLAAQTYSISGTVQDASGARVPHAHIAAHAPGSASTLNAETGSQGEFRLTPDAPGTYQIEATAPGFRPSSATASVSDEAPSATVNLTLSPAGNTESVEVTADALAAETTSTQMGESLDAASIESVPLNGRNFTDLMAVQPGIIPSNTAQPGAVIMTGVASTPPSGDANPGNLSSGGQFFGAASVEGNISSSSFGSAVSAMPPRLMQMALRYRF